MSTFVLRHLRFVSGSRVYFFLLLVIILLFQGTLVRFKQSKYIQKDMTHGQKAHGLKLEAFKANCCLLTTVSSSATFICSLASQGATKSPGLWHHCCVNSFCCSTSLCNRKMIIKTTKFHWIKNLNLKFHIKLAEVILEKNLI